jgi:hypothetical protein
MAFQRVTSQAQVPFYIELEFCSKVQTPASSDDDDDEAEVRLVKGQKLQKLQKLQIPTNSKTETEFGSADNSPISPGRFAPTHSRLG